MKNPLKLYSEVVGPNGGVVGLGAAKVLGKPPLSPLSLLIREAVQNSWDARIPTTRQVSFQIAVRTIERPLQDYLASQVFPDADRAGVALRASLRRYPLLLSLTDSGTLGLEGPSRADKAIDGQPQRFTDFFRNLGSHQEAKGSGGTYGFGKTSLYRMSNAGTIAVLTRTRAAPGENLDLRFMAAALGPSVTKGREKLSGRHWWGKTSGRDPIADPITGDAAGRFAAPLGLKIAGNSGGTAIAVIAPRLKLGVDTKTEIIETILFNFWPKLVEPQDGIAPLAFRFQIEDEEIEIPAPIDHSRIRPFVLAYDAIASKARTAKVEKISVDLTEKSVVVGNLSVVRTPNPVAVQQNKKKWQPFGERCQHVCLLRAPELVVRYLPGPTTVGQTQGYAAVFRAADQFDKYFALAEPPAHDDWITVDLPKPAKQIVRGALSGIKEILTRETQTGSEITNIQADGVPLGAISSFLGELLDGVDGDGSAVTSREETSVSTKKSGVGRPRSKISVQVTDSRPIRKLGTGESVLTETDVEVRFPARVAAVTLEAVAAIQTADGGLETEPPDNAEGIRIEEWRDSTGAVVGQGEKIELTQSSKLTVVARMPARALGALTFTASENGAQ